MSWVGSRAAGPGRVGRPVGIGRPSRLAPASPLTRPCPPAPAVSEFFSASCVPVNNAKNYPASLCALCVGDERGRNKCVGNSQERYFGYSGAFRYSAGLAGRPGASAEGAPSCQHRPRPLSWQVPG